MVRPMLPESPTHGGSGMARTKTYRVILTDAERRSLQQMVRTGVAPARQILRGRILLKADEAGAGWGDARVAQALEVGPATVLRVRRDFAQRGLPAAVARRPQPPRPQRRALDGAGEARLVQLACSAAPAGHDHWTLELLADRLVKLHQVAAVSPSTLCRVLKKKRTQTLAPGAVVH